MRPPTDLVGAGLACVRGGQLDLERRYRRALDQEANRCSLIAPSPFRLFGSPSYADCMTGYADRAFRRALDGDV